MLKPGGAETKLTNTNRYVWVNRNMRVISRFVVDAQVLPIFEGAKPILELKVIGRQLLGG